MMMTTMMILTMMFMMCFLHPKGYQAQSAPGGWGMAINYDEDDDDDDNGDDDDDHDDDHNSDDVAKFSQA